MVCIRLYFAAVMVVSERGATAAAQSVAGQVSQAIAKLSFGVAGGNQQDFASIVADLLEQGKHKDAMEAVCSCSESAHPDAGLTGAALAADGAG